MSDHVWSQCTLLAKSNYMCVLYMFSHFSGYKLHYFSVYLGIYLVGVNSM